MESVTAVRLQVPMPSSSSHPAPDRLTSVPVARTARPVAEPMRRDAVSQAANLVTQVSVDLADHDKEKTPVTVARAAADAAREAYIHALIAAGLSPPPLP